MKIRKIKFNNFKSFGESEVTLSDLNIIIGANASGKSNFVNVFKFLRELANYGIENAISMQGGLDYTLNVGKGREVPLEFEIDSECDERMRSYVSCNKPVIQRIRNVKYQLAIDYSQSKTKYKILRDRTIYKCEIYRSEHSRVADIKDENKLGEADFIYEKAGEDLRISLRVRKGGSKIIRGIYDIKEMNDLFQRIKLPPNNLTIQTKNMFVIPELVREQFEAIAIYDFDPKLSKVPQIVTGRLDLEENGSNLAAVLNSILNSNKKNKLNNIIFSNLSFINRIRPKRVANNMMLQLEEKYHSHTFFPGFLISDGTINFVALIIALYFQDKPLKIVEEPERNLHPYLLSRIVDMMREVSESQQIITTSHNPEIIKYTKPSEILLVKRADNGDTDIIHPSDSSNIKTFLTNEMGLSELFVQNMLEVLTK